MLVQAESVLWKGADGPAASLLVAGSGHRKFASEGWGRPSGSLKAAGQEDCLTQGYVSLCFYSGFQTTGWGLLTLRPVLLASTITLILSTVIGVSGCI